MTAHGRYSATAGGVPCWPSFRRCTFACLLKAKSQSYQAPPPVPACLLATGLPACLLPAGLPACLPASRSACLQRALCLRLPSCQPACLPASLPAWLPAAACLLPATA